MVGIGKTLSVSRSKIIIQQTCISHNWRSAHPGNSSSNDARCKDERRTPVRVHPGYPIINVVHTHMYIFS